MMAESLRTAGYEVQTARHGGEGLSKFEAEPWDVVVTDRAMPHLSGEEMALAIRALNPKARIILVSGLPCACVAPEIFDAILAKPFRGSQLLDTVADVFLRLPHGGS